LVWRLARLGYAAWAHNLWLMHIICNITNWLCRRQQLFIIIIWQSSSSSSSICHPDMC
jgi:hypothetical protein